MRWAATGEIPRYNQGMEKVPIELIIDGLHKPAREATVPLYAELELPLEPLPTVVPEKSDRGVIKDVWSDSKISFEIDI